MSAFRKAAKARQRQHHERLQPEARRHLGILEKKADYKKRADEYNTKQKELKKLKQQALDRNPDEFYFKMVRTTMEEGIHQHEDNAPPEYTEEQLFLMQTQDLKYVKFRQSLEAKKIERLKSQLHVTEADRPRNKKTIFVDSVKDATKRLKSSKQNPRAQLKSVSSSSPPPDPYVALEATRNKYKAYKELNKRIARLKQLDILAQKMHVKKELMKNKNPFTKPELVSKETVNTPAVYKWRKERQK